MITVKDKTTHYKREREAVFSGRARSPDGFHGPVRERSDSSTGVAVIHQVKCRRPCPFGARRIKYYGHLTALALRNTAQTNAQPDLLTTSRSLGDNGPSTTGEGSSSTTMLATRGKNFLAHNGPGATLPGGHTHDTRASDMATITHNSAPIPWEASSGREDSGGLRRARVAGAKKSSTLA